MTATFTSVGRSVSVIFCYEILVLRWKIADKCPKSCGCRRQPALILNLVFIKIHSSVLFQIICCLNNLLSVHFFSKETLSWLTKGQPSQKEKDLLTIHPFKLFMVHSRNILQLVVFGRHRFEWSQNLHIFAFLFWNCLNCSLPESITAETLVPLRYPFGSRYA